MVGKFFLVLSLVVLELEKFVDVYMGSFTVAVAVEPLVNGVVKEFVAFRVDGRVHVGKVDGTVGGRAQAEPPFAWAGRRFSVGDSGDGA